MSDLESLMQLQEIDLKISELTRAQEEFPAAISTFSKTIKNASDSVDALSKRLTEAVSEKKSIEDKLADAKTQLDKSQERLNTIKTNREYDAVHTQIENFKNTLAGGDSKLKALAQNSEQVQQSFDAASAELEKIKLENEPHIAEIKAKVDTLSASIAELVEQRGKIVGAVSKALLRTYEYILKRRKNGQVLSFVSPGARTCSVCYKILEPQLIGEIRRGAKMTTCQNCGSIFIWKIEPAPPQ
jgi:predicted  nucleic acid-binding Zn-ribbon protein